MQTLRNLPFEACFPAGFFLLTAVLLIANWSRFSLVGMVIVISTCVMSFAFTTYLVYTSVLLSKELSHAQRELPDEFPLQHGSTYHGVHYDDET